MFGSHLHRRGIGCLRFSGNTTSCSFITKFGQPIYLIWIYLILLFKLFLPSSLTPFFGAPWPVTGPEQGLSKPSDKWHSLAISTVCSPLAPTIPKTVGLIRFCRLHFGLIPWLPNCLFLGNDEIESQLQRLMANQDIKILLSETRELGKFRHPWCYILILIFSKSTLLRHIYLIHYSRYRVCTMVVQANYPFQYHRINPCSLSRPPILSWQLIKFLYSTILEAICLKLVLAFQNNIHCTGILSLPVQIETDVLPHDVGEAILLCATPL